MQLRYSLISLVLQAEGLGMEVNPGSLEEIEIVASSPTEEGADDFTRLLVDEELAFERMLLLFAGIEVFLLALGPLNRGLGYIHHHHIRSAKTLD